MSSDDGLGLGPEAASQSPPDPDPAARPSTSFTIEFDEGKVVDRSRIESLLSKCRARHQRAQSTSASASWRRPSPTARHKPPSSARLPRKAHGYHSEGYFSSDQEDASLPSKDVMTRSDVSASNGRRAGLVLPLKKTHAPETPVFGGRFFDGDLKDATMIADTSSPELEPPTPASSRGGPGGASTAPTPLEPPRAASPSSTVSEAGTYTIEADNYTEEQKAKMNIDEAFGVEDFAEPIRRALDDLRRAEEAAARPRPLGIREELLLAGSTPDPARKASAEGNVLEISCRYESPTEAEDPPRASKSAKGYLERIKSKVKNISEKTFHKTPKTPESPLDPGSFTSVTASGVLGGPIASGNRPAVEPSRKNGLTKSKIDSTEYVHRPKRDDPVRQKVSDESFAPSSEPRPARTVAENPPCESTPEQILIGKLSHLSLNRCQGDKSWIREWADSVKRHNKETVMNGAETVVTGLPPASPRHSLLMKGIASPKCTTPPSGSPTKIPSPVCTLVRQKAPVPDILTSTPDTETYLQNTQNVISSLQAKLQNAKSSPLANLDQTLFQDKFNSSKLPVSQLNRSNSLNYRLYRKTGSAESSPLRNPGNYLVTGTQGMPTSARLLLSNLGASKSLDTDPNASPVNGSYYSPILQTSAHDRFNCRPYNKYDDKYSKDLHSDNEVMRGRTHLRHHSFDDRNIGESPISPDQFDDDFNNANMTQSLNLKSSTKNVFDGIDDRTHRRHLIDQTLRNILSPSNQRHNIKLSHHRGLSDTYTTNQLNKDFIHAQIHPQRLNTRDAQNSPIRRSSSFNIVNKNNNIYDNNMKNQLGSPLPRISSATRSRNLSHRQDKMQTSDYARHNTPEVDCMSEDSDNISTGGFYSDYDRRSMRKSNTNDLLVGARCNRAFALRRARLESPDARPQNNINSTSPRCPATPEMKRKFSGDHTKRNARAPTRDSRSTGPINRISDVRPDVCQVADVNKNQKNKKISETLKQNITNRLTRSSSSAKDFAPKFNDKAQKKPVKGNLAISTKEVEFTNWKKRTSYDPMKAAQEGKKKLLSEKIKNDDDSSSRTRIEDVSSPSHSSPVHRSRSFNCTNTPIDERLYLLQQLQNDGSSDTDDFEDRLICTLPNEGSANAPILKMVSAAEAETELASKLANAPDVTKRTKSVPQNNQIKLSNDYIAKLHINSNADVKKPSLIDKRRTYLVESDQHQVEYDSLIEADKRRTFILDSDTTTNSTTNGSGSRRNSSVYSDEKVNNERLSDSEVESDTEPIVNVVPRVKSKSVPPQQRHSGDFSMSSSTCSASKETPSSKKSIQPRYLDISRFKNDSSTNKNFLRRDPSKTYVGVLPVQDQRHQAKKNAARQNEQELKNKELEKWKRRASYDPRKAAAQGKGKPVGSKSPSNSVLRSQSFHGPMMQATKLTIIPAEKKNAESFYQDISSDNEF